MRRSTSAEPPASGGRVTMEDVARRAGVSRALVSIAFRGAKGVSEESKQAIFAAATELGYRHNTIAADLAARSTNTLGLFILDIHNEVFADIFTGLREAARSSARRVVLAIGDASHDGEAEIVDSLLRTRVETLVLAGTLLPDSQLTSIARTTPLVTVTRLVPGIASVAADDHLGGALAVRHLIEFGHREIAYLAPPLMPLYQEREAGYAAAMQEAGLRPRVIRTGLERDSAARDARALLMSSSPPTAIFAYNDLLAYGVLEAAHSLQIAVPEELSVIGYDNTRGSDLPGLALTTIDQQASRLGALAAELALDSNAISDAVHRLVEPSLVVRSTTAPLAERS